MSGGPDSLALLLLAHAALPGRIEAATVDHQLRVGSAEEAADVARLCQSLAVPHAILAVDVAPGNLQSQARAARYAALAVWLTSRGLAALASGHHADDQAETLLARLNRASGVAGLAGVRARGLVPGTDIPLLRPLLGWRRAALADVVAVAGVLSQWPGCCRCGRVVAESSLRGLASSSYTGSASACWLACERVRRFMSMPLRG